MNKALAFLSVASICAAVAGATGCESDEGAPTWTASDMEIVGDDTCGLFDPEETLVFEITIEGSTVTMELVIPPPEGEPLQVSTDSYDPTDNQVTLEGSQLNSDYDPPCVVELNDEFELTLDDPDVSLDENTTVQVTWDHDEIDVSETVGDCAGEWFVDLPCSGRATLTLTQD